MIEFVLFDKKVTNLVELIEVVCENVLDSNYFMGNQECNLLENVDLCDIVKPYLDNEEIKEFEKFLDEL